MLLFPKKTKYKKYQKIAFNKTCIEDKLVFGNLAIKSEDYGIITSNSIESARISITRSLKKVGFLWFRIFPDKPITKKPAEVRMGNGKGSIDKWGISINPGKIILEIQSPTKKMGLQILKVAQSKLPLRTKIVFLDK
uniref:Ribosomal protein L16 n=1 Tax=Gloeochaete wittrockiana TaxID=38269 RepID=A0A096Y6R3_9EUKA|nr:ribosomal protein L16 [Gloeochaete wittrockiana]AIM52009.1 ribosomal protein L16 [Gloeochaete wittrockiana]